MNERAAANSVDAEGVDDPIVCFCNEICLSAVVSALDAGASTLTAIIDATFAGCGACGGSCQPDLEAILEDWYSDEALPDGP